MALRMTLRFMYPLVLYGGVALLFCAILWRKFFSPTITYNYPYVDFFRSIDTPGAIKKGFSVKFLLLLIRSALFLLLLVAIARPQIINENSQVWVEGRDIIISLDASGSMNLFDDLKDKRSRFFVLKSEALKFIKKRKNDQIGLVAFGNVAVSIAPLTLDKNLLHEIVTNLSIGDIDQNGTVLAISLGMAVKRLSTSKAKSKIVILITDGVPSRNDIAIDQILNLLKKYNIKVYTIGVG